MPWIALLFTGMAGLVYETVWARAMATLFGSVLPATGTLLALFMAGMGVGAALGGRLAASTRRPLAAFGLVELVVGGLALTTPGLLRAAVPLVARLDVALPDRLALLVPAALSVLVLGPIVVLLGATFPLFLAHASRGTGGLGSAPGRVYGVNTLGAVIGTVAAGFLLVPALGIASSLTLAACIDLAVGALCLALGLAGTRAAGDSTAPRVSGPAGPDEMLCSAVAFVGGAAALLLEVVWLRALMLAFGSSVYALASMLAAFLVGLSLGSLWGGRGQDATLARLGQLHLLIAFAATLVTVVLQLAGGLYIPLVAASHGSFPVLAGGSAVILLVLLVVPTSLMGAALPLAIRLGAAGGGRAEVAAGRVYAASSLGSSLGALAAGFVLVPRLGLRGACCVAALLSVGAGLTCAWRAGERRQRRLATQVAALTLGLWVAWAAGLFPWDWRVLTAGYYAYGHLYSRDRPPADGPTRRSLLLAQAFPFVSGPADPEIPAAAKRSDDRLLSWEEGAFAQVAVVQDKGVRSLLVNGKADASDGSGDMRTQLLLGHLPVLLAPTDASGEAMVIGLGSGVTAAAVAAWPFEKITVAEIEPAVIRASRWFAQANRGVLDDPRVVLHADDGRRVLARSPGGLALITSEPSNLWMSGVSLLFTREFFELAAARLGPDGVLCQWLHLYQVGPADVRCLLATMSGPFPHLLVTADGSDMLVVASRSPLQLDPAVWQRRLAQRPQAADELARAGIRSAVDLAGAILVDERGLGPWVAGAPLHTDDRPLLEFTAARHTASDYSGPILAALVRAGEAAGEIRLGSSGVVGAPSRPPR